MTLYKTQKPKEMKWMIIYNFIADSEDSDDDIYGYMHRFKTKRKAKNWIKNASHHYKNIKLFKDVKI